MYTAPLAHAHTAVLRGGRLGLAAACGVPLWAARWRMETRQLWAPEENHRQLY